MINNKQNLRAPPALISMFFFFMFMVRDLIINSLQVL